MKKPKKTPYIMLDFRGVKPVKEAGYFDEEKKQFIPTRTTEQKTNGEFYAEGIHNDL